MFETRIPRNSASRQDAEGDRQHAEQQQDPVGIVSVFARTMLA